MQVKIRKPRRFSRSYLMRYVVTWIARSDGDMDQFPSEQLYTLATTGETMTIGELARVLGIREALRYPITVDQAIARGVVHRLMAIRTRMDTLVGAEDSPRCLLSEGVLLSRIISALVEGCDLDRSELLGSDNSTFTAFGKIVDDFAASYASPEP